jgi:SAM-dependent MidA family methyltransferase
MLETIVNTTLAARLRERITIAGPLSFRDWMTAALYDAQDGYYCRTDRVRWGREGDYRTSPERSAMFAATFARYFARLHEELGSPAEWTITELGAGNGAFACGVLETLRSFFPAVFAATAYSIDEVSRTARTQAQERLVQFADRVSFRPLSETKVTAGVIFSNELLDAFPVHRVIYKDHRLLEFFVAVNAAGNFTWLQREPGSELSARFEKYFKHHKVQLSEGQIAEVNLEVENWFASIAENLRRGYLITVDYGASAADLYSVKTRPEGSLRGFQRHEFVTDLLARPGERDLTTTVNWSQVLEAGSRYGFEVREFEQQNKFLLSAGILEQLQLETSHRQSEAERTRLRTAAREMILPGGMAAHFQVLVQKRIGTDEP